MTKTKPEPPIEAIGGGEIDPSTLAPPNPWQPVTDVKTIKILGKLSEELGELQSAVSRVLIQGIDGSHPVTGFPNRTWLGHELADVMAGIVLAKAHFNYGEEELFTRMEAKLTHLRAWHAMK